jgi:hypothetical protein
MEHNFGKSYKLISRLNLGCHQTQDVCNWLQTCNDLQCIIYGLWPVQLVSQVEHGNEVKRNKNKKFIVGLQPEC